MGAQGEPFADYDATLGAYVDNSPRERDRHLSVSTCGIIHDQAIRGRAGQFTLTEAPPIQPYCLPRRTHAGRSEIFLLHLYEIMGCQTRRAGDPHLRVCAIKASTTARTRWGRCATSVAALPT